MDWTQLTHFCLSTYPRPVCGLCAWWGVLIEPSASIHTCSKFWIRYCRAVFESSRCPWISFHRCEEEGVWRVTRYRRANVTTSISGPKRKQQLATSFRPERLIARRRRSERRAVVSSLNILEEIDYTIARSSRSRPDEWGRERGEEQPEKAHPELRLVNSSFLGSSPNSLS